MILQVFIHNPFSGSSMKEGAGSRLVTSDNLVPDLYYLNIGQQVLKSSSSGTVNVHPIIAIRLVLQEL